MGGRLSLTERGYGKERFEGGEKKDRPSSNVRQGGKGLGDKNGIHALSSCGRGVFVELNEGRAPRGEGRIDLNWREGKGVGTDGMAAGSGCGDNDV